MKSELQKAIAKAYIEASEKRLDQDTIEALNYGTNYLKSAKNALDTTPRRFDNDLIYNIISMSFEQLMVGLLSHHEWIASSHLPLMLYREALPFEPDMGDSIKQTAILIGSFEGICSIDDFGYKTPTDKQLVKMVDGLNELEAFIAARVSSTNS